MALYQACGAVESMKLRRAEEGRFRRLSGRRLQKCKDGGNTSSVLVLCAGKRQAEM